MKITINQLSDILLNSVVIQDAHTGPKVVMLSNNNYLKIFRLKTWFSSALFYHYADRFVDNAINLAKLGIMTVKPVNKYIIPQAYIKDSKYTKAVEYEYLPGQTFRNLILNKECSLNIIEDFARFIALLHYKGIYFKAIHFANIIYHVDFKDKFGLIDIDNMKLYSRPLSFKLRQKNFKQMMRYQADTDWLQQNKKLFLDIYIANSLAKNTITTKFHSLLNT